MLNNAWPSLPKPSPLLSFHSSFISFISFLLGSPSAHHSTQQINCRVKLRLANQGDGSRALGSDSKRERDGEGAREKEQMSHLSLREGVTT